MLDDLYPTISPTLYNMLKERAEKNPLFGAFWPTYTLMSITVCESGITCYWPKKEKILYYQI